MSEPASAENIRRAMHDVRGHLDVDVGEVIVHARQMVDWREYVRRSPWLAVCAATALGIALVPRRVKVVNYDAGALAKLAREDRLAIQVNGKREDPGGLVGTLMSIALSAATRGATAWLSSQVGRMIETWATSSQPEPEPTGQERWRELESQRT